MFTVLHRGPDGSEVYYEAETVTRFAGVPGGSVPPLGEIRLTHSNGFPSVPGCHISLAVEEPFGAVFVMNDQGHTVAKYTLAGKVGPGLEAAGED